MEIFVYQAHDVFGHGQAESGGSCDDDLFVGGGKSQRTLPVTVAVGLVPLPVGFLPSVADRHGKTPFH